MRTDQHLQETEAPRSEEHRADRARLDSVERAALFLATREALGHPTSISNEDMVIRRIVLRGKLYEAMIGVDAGSSPASAIVVLEPCDPNEPTDEESDGTFA